MTSTNPRLLNIPIGIDASRESTLASGKVYAEKFDPIVVPSAMVGPF
jgi:hypothetical protein